MNGSRDLDLPKISQTVSLSSYLLRARDSLDLLYLELVHILSSEIAFIWHKGKN
jgi:hypothetical protein